VAEVGRQGTFRSNCKFTAATIDCLHGHDFRVPKNWR
jgi:hypothetical protein